MSDLRVKNCVKSVKICREKFQIFKKIFFLKDDHEFPRQENLLTKNKREGERDRQRKAESERDRETEVRAVVTSCLGMVPQP